MITCKLCGDRMARNPLLSAYAIIAVHWMDRHPREWVRMHPESAPYMPNVEDTQ